MTLALVLLYAATDATLVAQLPAERASDVALDGRGFAYVGSFFGDAIYRIPLRAPGKPIVLYRSPGRNIGGLEVRGDRLRWSSTALGRIYEAPLDGRGAIRMLAGDMPGIVGFHTDERWIYWTDMTGSVPGGLWRKPIGGGPSTLVARHQGQGHAVIADGPDGDLLFSCRTAILRVRPGDGRAEVWQVLDGDHVAAGLAQDRDFFYVATYKGQSVVRIDKRSGRREVIARVEGAPFGVAVDEGAVYFTTYMPPALWMRAKTR